MRKLLVFVSVVVLLPSLLFSCKTKEYGYEVVPVAVGSQGSYLIKVYSYAKNRNAARDKSKKNAVHAVLFKGIPGGNGVYNQKPLVTPQQYDTHKNFFEKFFQDGTYLRYVSVSTDGTNDPNDLIRVGNQYKIGVIVSVRKDDLRKYLEENNIIQKLGGMF